MMKNNLRDIKRKKREVAILRGIAPLLQQSFKDSEELKGLYISRLELSQDCGLCTIYLACFSGDIDELKIGLRAARLLTPSTRTAVAKVLNTHYTPEILFKDDRSLDKLRDLNQALEKVSNELKQSDKQLTEGNED
jgi:ribosome-binding factor A